MIDWCHSVHRVIIIRNNQVFGSYLYEGYSMNYVDVYQKLTLDRLMLSRRYLCLAQLLLSDVMAALLIEVSSTTHQSLSKLQCHRVLFFSLCATHVTLEFSSLWSHLYFQFYRGPACRCLTWKNITLYHQCLRKPWSSVSIDELCLSVTTSQRSI